MTLLDNAGTQLLNRVGRRCRNLRLRRSISLSPGSRNVQAWMTSFKPPDYEIDPRIRGLGVLSEALVAISKSSKS